MGWHDWFAFPEPRRGGMIVAGAAARGKKPPHPPSFSLRFLTRWRRAKTEEKKEEIIFAFVTPGGASLARAIIMSSLRDFSLARCARKVAERSSSGTAAGGKAKPKQELFEYPKPYKTGTSAAVACSDFLGHGGQSVDIAGQKPATVALLAIYRHTMPGELSRFPACARGH